MAVDNTCFVIMPIGDQHYGSFSISALELRKKYDDLIKDAILQANPSLDVTRADDVHAPGSITNDIFTRLMHSGIVIADITYPNPNVFYELGIRHAIKPGCILIKERIQIPVPFDISHLRHIEYENTATGLKELVKKLKYHLEWQEKNPTKPDNQFLELAKLTNYKYPDFTGEEEKEEKQVELITQLFLQFLGNANLMHLATSQDIPESEKSVKMIQELSKSPEIAGPLIRILAKSKSIKF